MEGRDNRVAVNMEKKECVQIWTQNALDALVMLDNVIEDMRLRLGPVLNAESSERLKPGVAKDAEPRSYSDLRATCILVTERINDARVKLTDIATRVDL